MLLKNGKCNEALRKTLHNGNVPDLIFLVFLFSTLQLLFLL
jgi:hypothetical protein